MGGRSSKPASRRPSNKQVGSCAATTGIILGGIALFLDQLTSLYSDKDDDDANGYCGFNTYRVEYGTSDDVSAIYAAYYYNYCCDEDNTCPFDSDKTDDYCNTFYSGVAWLLFGIIALILALVAIGAVAYQKDGAAKCGDIGACLCAVVAIAAWYIENPICWDDDSVDDEEQRMGASIILMIIAAVFFGLGGFCNCR